MADYGARTGVTTLIFLADKLCRLYVIYSAKINAWIDASSISSADKLVIKNWLNALNAVCVLLNSIGDD